LEKECYYTESSINADKELQEYKWALDKNKEPTNQPIDDWNHFCDSCRYSVWTHNHDPAGFIGFV
jgi:phage terminase large subunit